MWSNGLTAYPTGDEVGAAVTTSYRAVFALPRGRTLLAAPLAVADLHDHQTAANADNMHNICLGQVPPGARLRGIRIDTGLIQDPNGDPNAVERLRLRPSEMPSAQARVTP